MDFRHHIFSIDLDGHSFRGAQRHMQHGALLRDIDLVPAKQGLDSFFQAGLPGQLKQELERFVGHAILGVVQVDARSLDGHTLATLRIVCEEPSQMDP